MLLQEKEKKEKEEAQKYFPNLCSIKPLHGGDISATYLLKNKKGERRVLKLHSGHFHSKELVLKEQENLFIREVEGLSALRQGSILSVPKVFSFDKNHLLMEYLPPISYEKCSSVFWKKLGIQLAKKHQESQFPFFGLEQSNFIGRSPQKNILLKDDGKSAWAHFFIEYRLDVQMHLIQKAQGPFPSKEKEEIYRRYKEKRDILWDILYRAQKNQRFYPALLHGDLWSGNILFCTKDNLPYLIDPAIYYGHWEADLAMTKLFGAFPPSFYKSYCSVQAYGPDWEKREKIYKLYHLLNHLHLFGESYLIPCLSLLKEIKLN